VGTRPSSAPARPRAQGADSPARGGASPRVSRRRLRTLWAWYRKRPAAAAASVYAVLALALVSPALAPGQALSSSDYFWSAVPWAASRPAGVRPLGSNWQASDPPSQFQPFLQYTRATLPGIPLWNPYIMAGRPFLANAQSGVFSPFSLPAYVLPFWRSLALIAALKVFVAAFGAYLLGRALRMRFGGAMLAGLVYGFGLFMVVWLPWPLASVWALIPWLLLMTEAVVRRPGLLPVSGLALVVALQFLAGHPESSFHALFATGAFLVLRLAMARRAHRSQAGLARPLAGFAAAMVGGAALAAVAVVPFGELLLRSADIANRAGAPPARVDANFLLGLLLPDYWGRPTAISLQGVTLEHAFYVGALPLMLAAAALIVRPALERVAIALFGALCLAVVVGAPPVFEAVNALPGFSVTHNTRMTILFVLCVALLAGWGIDEIASPRMARVRQRVVLGLGATLLVTPVVWMAAERRSSLRVLGSALDVAWGFAHPRGSPLTAGPVIRLAALLVWLVVAGAALVLLGLRLRRGLAANAFVGLGLALVTLDLFRAGVGQNPSIPRSDAMQPATGAIRYLQARRPARFVGGEGYVVQPVPANVAMRYRLYDARGYDWPVERRYDTLWRRDVAPNNAFIPTSVAPITGRSLRALSLLSVADVLEAPGGAPLTGPGLRLAYQGSDARIYANAGALPRAFLVDAQHVVSGGQAALDAVSAAGFDGRRVAVVERRLPGLPVAGATGTAAPPGSAGIASYGPEHVVLQARAPRPGLLVLTDVYYPGWRATVDGRPASIARVDYLLRGVRVPAGAHRVELRYKPISWTIGWIVSLLALAGLAAASLAGWRARRRA